ncbi:GWxTD domain-containing protein [Bacteroidota bacterium]
MLWVPLLSKGIVVFVNQGVFKYQDDKSFTELFLKIPVGSIHLQKNENDRYLASVNIELSYSKKDSVYYTGVYNIVSPEFSDTTNLNFALTDIIRVILPYGIYKMDLLVTDNHQSENKTIFSSIVNTQFRNSLISFSDILFADTVYSSQVKTVFTRNNYNILPNVFNSYSSRQKKLFFYAEFYNADKFISTETFFVKYFLLKDSIKLKDYQHTVKLKVYSTNYVIGNFDISDLPIGNYELLVEVYNTKNLKLASRSSFFSKQQNSNVVVEAPVADSKVLLAQLIKSYSKEQLLDYIEYIRFLSDEHELNEAELLKRKSDAEELSEYFYQFWLKQDSENPAKSWLTYLARIEECNRLFTTQLRKGYLTDRGRVFMDYGPPNNVVESENGMLTYPFQIWHYYRLPDFQQNKKFVFFNKTGAMDEYELIHSNASGEVQNTNWKDMIRKFNKLNVSEDEVFGDYLDEYFDE